jgi:LacI family transcriptional regulator, galactose operon repressor
MLDFGILGPVGFAGVFMATIRDVAEAAGVSVATVSRVLNGSTRVASRTRARVEGVVAKLDYWPHAAARSLNTSRTHTLGVLLPDLHGQFFSEVMRGVDQGAREQGFQILVSSSHADTETLMAGARAMSGRVDGLIVMAPDQATTGTIGRLSRRFPVVLLNPPHPVEGCGVISVANFEGAVGVVEHLIRSGHRAIGIIKGPKENTDAEERFRGYRHALAEAELAPVPAHEFAGDFTETSGFLAGLEIARLQPRPTAIFATNDCMATGLLSALRQTGVDVPEDVAVVGFDDIPIAEFLSPRLTTVHVNAYELGNRAVRMLLKSLGGRGAAPDLYEVLPVKLILRQSCRTGHTQDPAALLGSPAASRAIISGGGIES